MDASPLSGPVTVPRPGVGLLPLAADSPEALRALARAAATRLSSHPSLPDLISSATRNHTEGRHRLALLATDPAEVCRALLRFSQTGRLDGGWLGETDGARPTLVFVCAGYGGQWAGMGRALARLEPTFEAALDRCDRTLGDLGADWSVAELIRADRSTGWLTDVSRVLPTLVCLQLAMAALWRERGVEPDAVIGHSIGEVAAASVAGALTLDDAVRVGLAFGQVLESRRGSGSMALVGLSAAELEPLLAPHGGRVVVAGRNGPRATLLAGDRAPLETVVAGVRGRRAFGRTLDIDIPAHSPTLDPAAATELADRLIDLRPAPLTRLLVSTVTGTALPGPALDGGHWGRSLRAPVRFTEALDRLMEVGPVTAVELGPHPVLLSAVEAQLGTGTGRALPSLRRGDEGRETALRTLATLYVAGQPVNWTAVMPTASEPSHGPLASTT